MSRAGPACQQRKENERCGEKKRSDQNVDKDRPLDLDKTGGMPTERKRKMCVCFFASLSFCWAVYANFGFSPDSRIMENKKKKETGEKRRRMGGRRRRLARYGGSQMPFSFSCASVNGMMIRIVGKGKKTKRRTFFCLVWSHCSVPQGEARFGRTSHLCFDRQTVPSRPPVSGNDRYCGDKTRHKTRGERSVPRHLVMALDLPDELTEHILDFLDGYGLTTCVWVCAQWRRIVEGLERRGRWRPRSVRYAVESAQRGHLAILQWAVREGCPLGAGVCDAAVRTDRTDILAWTYARYMYVDADMMAEAARHDALDVLRWLFRRQRTLTVRILAAAARHGSVGMVRWLCEQKCPRDASVASAAVRSGRLDVLEFLRERRCAWDETTCAAAAEVGRLDMLQYARSGGCPWDKRTCECAAESGSVEVLRWAVQNGCPYDYLCLYKAQGREALAFVQGLFA